MSGKRILSDDQVHEACTMRERGLSCQQISNHFAAAGVKVSAGSISWACLTRGADLPPSRRGHHNQSHRPGRTYNRGGHVIRTFTPEDDALLRALDMQGFAVSVIARRMDRKSNSIRGRLATLARHDARREESAGLA